MTNEDTYDNEDESPVSPKNTEKLYADDPMELEPPVAGQAETIETELPEDLDYVDENMFPSAD